MNTKYDNQTVSELLELGAIAVIGMAGEFSGAKNIDEYWSLLCSGLTASQFTSVEEAARQGVKSHQTSDENYVPWAMPMEDIDQFDCDVFDMTSAQAEVMDPQCRRFLQVCWNSLENAGIVLESLDEIEAGIVACSNSNGYLAYTVGEHIAANHHAKALQVMTGNSNDFLATWAAYKLNLTGPAMTVQTACSSSLVAIANACLQLQTYQADLMIAGGSGLSLPQDLGYVRQQGSILSADGQCQPFTAKASGTLNGHAVAAVVLKRIEDAVENGDHIWGVIRGSAINNDGQAKMDFMAPGVKGQTKVMNKALQLSGLSANDIQYIETHGTGTLLGDEIELGALSEVYGGQAVSKKALGAVKSNIGHANAAAGIAGFIKTILSIYHGKIVPNAGVTEPRPELMLDHNNFYLPSKLMSWPTDITRRASISSLGFGGTNAHLVIEQAPYQIQSNITGSEVNNGRQSSLFVLSATDQTALEKQCTFWATWLQEHQPTTQQLDNICQTLRLGRHHFAHRIAEVADDWQSLVQKLKNTKVQIESIAVGSTVLAFTGQGAQWQGMGNDLYTSQSVFKNATDECDAYLDRALNLAHAADVFGGGIEFTHAFSSAVGAHYYQFCYQYALAKTYLSYGISADIFVGHSLGEFAVAVLCQVITLKEAIYLVSQRGLAIEQHCQGRTQMMAVDISKDTVLSLLPDTIDLAVVNSQQQCVLAGSSEELVQFEHQLIAQGYSVRMLKTTHGFHSRQMDTALEAFSRACNNVDFKPVIGRWISSVTGEELRQVDTNYWLKHLRNTVRFDRVLSHFHHDSLCVIECGAKPVLSGLFRLNYPGNVYASTGTSGDEIGLLNRVLGTVFCCHGITFPKAVYDKVALPGYQFSESRYWSADVPHSVRWRSTALTLSEVQIEKTEDDEFTAWLKSLWRSELGQSVTIVDKSDFYTLGGNSLSAIQICDQLEKQLGLSFPVSDFLNQRTFSQFMAHLLTLAEQQSEEEVTQ